MAQRKRAMFAAIGVGVMLMQAAVVLASATVCARHCEQSQAAASPNSCCKDKAPAPKEESCRDECLKSFDSNAIQSDSVAYVNAPLFDVQIDVARPSSSVRLLPRSESVLYSSDSSPPPRSLIRTNGLRAPPVFGA